MIALKERALICLKGGAKLLQNVITNDVDSLIDGVAMYAFILSSHGRFLFDFYLYKEGDAIVIDCHHESRAKIIDYINARKFRAKISIEVDDRIVVHSSETGSYKYSLGYRSLSSPLETATSSDEQNEFHVKRIEAGVVDGYYDMVPDVSMPLDYGVSAIGGFSFTKGCYCGQEAISKARNIVGKQRDLFLVEVLGGTIPEKQSKILYEGVAIGRMCGIVSTKGLMVGNIKAIDSIDVDPLVCSGVKVWKQGFK